LIGGTPSGAPVAGRAALDLDQGAGLDGGRVEVGHFS